MEPTEQEVKVGPLSISIEEGQYSLMPSLAKPKENLFICIDWFTDDSVPMMDKSRLAIELGGRIEKELQDKGFKVRLTRFDLGTEEDIYCVITNSAAEVAKAKEVVNGIINNFRQEKFPFAELLSGSDQVRQER